MEQNIINKNDIIKNKNDFPLYSSNEQQSMDINLLSDISDKNIIYINDPFK